MSNKNRCKWCNLKNPLYIKYHDEEWCKPNFNEKYLFEIIVESLQKANKKYNVVIPWYIMTSEDNNDQTIQFLKENNFFGYDENKVKQYLLQNGDIVFARTGATVGKSYLIENLSEQVIYASYLIRVRTYSLILPQYVKYFFKSGYYWNQIEQNSFGVGQPNVNATILGNLNIPIPPIEEQKRIVKAIEQLLKQINKIMENL